MKVRVSRVENLELRGTCANDSDQEVAEICRDLSESNSTQRDGRLLQAGFIIHLKK